MNILKFPLSPQAKAGMLIKNMRDARQVSEHEHSKPHRDDHYLLLMATGGNFILNIDFENIEVHAPALLLIFPGQIHHTISSGKTSGWGISIDPALIDQEFQLIFERGFQRVFAIDQQTAFYSHITALMEQMEKLQTEIDNPYHVRAGQSMLDSLLALLAGEIAVHNAIAKTKANRAATIEQDFKQLLKVHYKDWKQPSRYAAQLNISVAHLSDTIKAINGDSVSVYIQQYCILEAKRLLCFTKLTVREVGYQLGYEDPVYFSKLFKKVTGYTPLQFRQHYLDQDHHSLV